MKLKNLFCRALLGLFLFGLPGSVLAGQAVGFLEKFALASDRMAALAELIPGTEDYYYYHALHFQNERKLPEFKKIMTEWEGRFSKSGRRKVIENREALIRHSDDPKATLEYLKREMALTLNHQQEGKIQEAKHPSVLAQDEVSWESFLKDALASQGSVKNLAPLGLHRFLEEKPKLNAVQRRDVLSALTTPDAPGLVGLILDDLQEKTSRGFGEHLIHRVLTKKQLEELLAAKGDLKEDPEFVNDYLVRLLPGPDLSMASSPEVREAYLDRAEAFVSTLSAPFNSLKAHLRFQRLVHDRALGQENAKRFLDYLSLPRAVSYTNPEWRKNEPASWRYPANLAEDFKKVTTFPPVASGEEALVRAYLLKFLKDARDDSKFSPYLRESWLRLVFAEAKITHGIGKPSDWASLLSPSQFEELKDRVDIEFDATNPEVFETGDEVRLSVHLKNVPKLMVKVFEINTLNYYRKRGDEVSTDIDLDGLVANSQEVYQYERAPQIREKIDFRVAAIPKRRGLWVVEFIGGGKSSRVVIRKGALGILSETVARGQLVTVLDEENKPLKGASIWVEGRQYDCDEGGRTLLPFSKNPGLRSTVIQDGQGFATLAKIKQAAESYRFSAGMYLEQEALRTGGRAKLLIRPSLGVAGEPISLSRIESASLELTSTNSEEVPVSLMVKDLKLASDREFAHDFRVPDHIVNLRATLRVKIKVASEGGKEIELTGVREFPVNGTNQGAKVSDLYLSVIDGRYRVEFLGKNGEPLSSRNLNFTFNRPGFLKSRSVILKTNERGAVDLGPLQGVGQVRVSAASASGRSWSLEGDRRDHIQVVTMKAGSELKVPFVGQLTRREVALFAVAKTGNYSDEFTRLRLADGYLTGKLPAGDYRLLLKAKGEEIKIMVGDGEISLGHLFNEARMLELPKRQPSHLKEIRAAGKKLEIEVAGMDALTRVHVLGTRFVPGFDPFAALGGSERSLPNAGQARFMPSLYISGRNLGDELRYILERRYAKKFPGVMLARPEVLLNPWAVRETESGREMLEAGDRFDRKATEGLSSGGGFGNLPSALRKSEGSVESPSYEFLADPPVMLANLVPDQNGRLSIDLAAFGDRQHLHVLLVDPDGSTYRTLSLKDRKTGIRDLRLMDKALDPKRHFTEQERVSFLKKGEGLKIPDLQSAQFEVYDNLGSVYRYLRNLNDDPVLRKFSFVANWPSLTDEEKKARYSEFACHELSFFLSRKDPEFFKTVIKPHLANKRDRTFLDDYLLGEALDRYFNSYEFARLNVVERILLSEQEPARLEALRLDLKNRLALQKDNSRLAGLWFATGVGGGGFGQTYAGAVRRKVVAKGGMDDAFAAELGDELAADKEEMPAETSEARIRKLAEQKAQKKAIREVDAKSRNALTERSMKFRGSDPFSGRAVEKLGVEQLYRALEVTREWAENHYYELPLEKQEYDLVGENRFWLDLAIHGTGPGFGSGHLGAASKNFTGMMFALSFLDLPFEAPAHEDEIEDGALDFKAGGNVLVFHREVRESGFAAERPPLLVSQSYFQLNDRFRMKDGQRVDKFLTEEFVKGVVYGSRIVVTNPTSSVRQLALLTQIPKGALPVLGQRATMTRPVELQPYATERVETAFYFPSPGEFPTYPAHLAIAGEVVAHADGLTFKVVDEPSKVDESSWEWISQWGGEKEVLDYLETGNLHAVDLSKMAWRCRESADFFGKALSILKRRGIYQPVVQGYAVLHNDKEALRDLLLMQESFLDQCGVALNCALVSVDPIRRRRYEHLEYRPLINNRAHALGGENRILNPAVREQYLDFLEVLSQQKALDHDDHLAVTYYLFLQDRVVEALAHLGKVEAGKLKTRMQYDYFQAYAAMCEADVRKARQLAQKYEKYPVNRWRGRFVVLLSQLDEIAGADPDVVEEGNREQEQQLAAAKEPSLKMRTEGTEVILEHRNLSEVTVNYYEMDLEFLFSTNPFVSSDSSRFDIIRPNLTRMVKLEKERETSGFELPADYRSSNLIVEVTGGGKRVSQAVYANDLRVSLAESMGLLTVREDGKGKPLAKVYVKVYADTPAGPRFFKDGYTDLRGKFDYASVSTEGLGAVKRFSLLVMSEENGATVLDARVPRR